MSKALPPRSGKPGLSQWFTAAWASELLIERHFPNLDCNDIMCEPSCGTGSFLGAIPLHVPAFGVELDPELAQIARERTGRPVIEGDFATVDLEFRPTAIIGNPPFSTKVVERFIARAAEILPEGGRMGLILPSFVFQTSRRLARWAETWSIEHEALPRDLFPELSKPLAFLLFSKDARRSLVGFALYREMASLKELKPAVRDTLARAVGGSAWEKAVSDVLQALGGEGELAEIYAAMGSKRPTANPYWREQTRKVLQQSFRRVGDGRWALPNPMLAAA